MLAALIALVRADTPTTEQSVLTIVFAALVTVAWLFPLPFAFKTDLCLDTSLLLAAVLLLDPVQAILLAAGGTALAHLIRRKELVEAQFNSAQVVLQVAGAAGVLAVMGWRADELELNRFGDVAAIALAALAMIAISDLSVAAMVAAQSRMNPVRTWFATIRQTSLVHAAAQIAQVGLGAAGAILVHASPWALGLLLLPAVAVHFSLATAQRERQRAAEALGNTEAALAEAERIAHLGSWEWDLATGRIHWSDEAYRILGVAKSDDSPNWATFLASVHPDDCSEVDRMVHQALVHGGPFCFEHRILPPDGRDRTVYAQGEVVRGAAGDKQRLVATIQDVTERKRTEQARDELLASLSHDLKSPLTVIQGQAQLLRRRLDRDPDPQFLARGLEKISASTQSMAVQISELLEFARQEMGSTLPPGPVDLTALVRERLELFGQVTERHTIRVQLLSEGPVAVGDRRQLGRALDNLLNNAIKYSPEGGEITVRVVRERDEAGAWGAISVQDHGIGIPEEDLPRIFDSYRRGSNVGRIEGSGIGLAGVKRLVALHGGTVAVASSLEAGTTFSLRLPVGS